MHALRLSLMLSLVMLALGCDARAVPAADEEPLSGEAALCASTPLPAASLDGAAITVVKTTGWVDKASSPAPGGTVFANHSLHVVFQLDDGSEVRVDLALDRMLAVGEEAHIDPTAPGHGGLWIGRGDDIFNGLSTVEGDSFSGRAAVARKSEHRFSATFCLVATRGASSRASFSSAYATLPGTVFSDVW